MIKKIISAITAAVLMLCMTGISGFAQCGQQLCFLSDCNNTGVEISAASGILIEAQTGTVLFTKNEKEHRQIASTTKIMTALLTIEAGDIDSQFTVDSTAIRVEGTSMGLREGDIVTRRALCYGMLLPSGNDAANAAAVNIAGSKESFAKLMNKRAKQLGMLDTNFVTPSGLDAEGQYSCAYDLAILTREAINNKDFAEICCLSKAKISFGSPPSERWLVNSNKLLTSYDGCIGVKTGFTDSARRTLVSAAERNGVRLIAVTLNAPNDWQDHTKLLDYGFSKVGMSETSYETSMLKLPVIGSDKDYVGIECETIELPLCEEQKDKLEAQVILPKFVYAHVSAGEQLGEVRFTLNGNIIGTAKLLAAESCTAQEQNNDFFTVIYKFIASLLAW